MKKLIGILIMSTLILSQVVVNRLVAEEMLDNETIEEDSSIVRPDVGGGRGFGFGGSIKPGIGPKKMKASKVFNREIAENNVLEIIKKNDELLYKKVLDLKKKDPVKYGYFIKIAFNMFAMSKDFEGDLDKDITRGISLEWDIRELSEVYNKSSEADKAKIKNEIKTKLNEIFDIRTRIMELRVKRVEKRLDELKNNISERKKNKQAIVNERLDRVLGNKKYMNW